MVKKSEVISPEFFHRYINTVKEDDVLKGIQTNTKAFRKFLKSIPKKKLDYAYAEGKWTIREVLQHIIDAERVFVLRALWFARKDANGQPGFDENVWAANAKVSGRKWSDMLDEFKALRKSTEAMFASFSEDELRAVGRSNNNEMSTGACGYVIAGHVNHHINVLKERYLQK